MDQNIRLADKLFICSSDCLSKDRLPTSSTQGTQPNSENQNIQGKSHKTIPNQILEFKMKTPFCEKNSILNQAGKSPQIHLHLGQETSGFLDKSKIPGHLKSPIRAPQNQNCSKENTYSVRSSQINHSQQEIKQQIQVVTPQFCAETADIDSGVVVIQPNYSQMSMRNQQTGMLFHGVQRKRYQHDATVFSDSHSVYSEDVIVQSQDAICNGPRSEMSSPRAGLNHFDKNSTNVLTYSNFNEANSYKANQFKVMSLKSNPNGERSLQSNSPEKSGGLGAMNQEQLTKFADQLRRREFNVPEISLFQGQSSDLSHDSQPTSDNQRNIQYLPQQQSQKQETQLFPYDKQNLGQKRLTLDKLNTTLMNSSTTRESRHPSSIFGSVQSPPHTSQCSSIDGQNFPKSSNTSAAASFQERLNSACGEKLPYEMGSCSNSTASNMLLKDTNFMSYYNKSKEEAKQLFPNQCIKNANNPLLPTSFTPNPKLLLQEQMQSYQAKKKNQVGENFVGLQTYILSELDSDEDKKPKVFLSDCSSPIASNLSDNCLDQTERKVRGASQSSSSTSQSSEEESKDIMHDLLTGSKSLLPKNNLEVINRIWQETPMVKQEQKGFLTDSPFVLKDPIFYSVPRNSSTNSKKVKFVNANRQLKFSSATSKNQTGSPGNTSAQVECQGHFNLNPFVITNSVQPSTDSNLNFLNFIESQKNASDTIHRGDDEEIEQFSSEPQQQNLINDKLKNKTQLLNLFNSKVRQGQIASMQPQLPASLSAPQQCTSSVASHSYIQKQHTKLVNTGLMFTPTHGQTIFEESQSFQSSDHSSTISQFSNIGQSTSPFQAKKAMQQEMNPQAVSQFKDAVALTNFNFAPFKASLTPMPKLQYAFSMPGPENQQSPSQPQYQNLKQFKVLNKERINRLKDDLNETPNSKYKYKNVAKDLKDCEKHGFQTIVKETFTKILTLPRKVHWRVVLDLADLAKRESKFREAKVLFKLVSYLQPYAYQGWLEYAKMQEECGNLEKAREILMNGLEFQPLNENLFIKTIKVEEKLGNLQAVRTLSQSLVNAPIERCWKIKLERALFEGRVGNLKEARKLFGELTKKCPSYGPIFFEASRFEEREGMLNEALVYCEDGLDKNPKYSPLWFQYLRLFEKFSEQERLKRFDGLQTILNEMFDNIPKELDWKIYVEAAQTYERLGQLDQAVGFLSNSIISSPDNIKWKIWLISARIQYHIGEVERARELIERCCYEVPSKQMSTAMLDYAKHFELRGYADRARQILQHTKRIAKAEWKIHLENVLFEIRQGNFDQAEDFVCQSLQLHFATGRLWATLIQLQHARARTPEDFDTVLATFFKSLKEIPKSGEVWCEGARLCMSNTPSNGKNLNYEKAERYLNFAIQFTPQYGDSFIEMLKLYLMTGQEDKIKGLKQNCIHSEPNYGVLWFFYKETALENAIEVWNRAESAIRKEIAYLEQQKPIEQWLGSLQLIGYLRQGLKDCPQHTKFKIIYGFEQVLPQVSFV